MIAVSAELNRAPFDQLEAESELISGFHTEYSGMKWGVIQVGEMGAIIGFSGIIAALFLSGFKGPTFLPGYIWFFSKMIFVLTLFIWVRATLPRLRIDQIMAFGWKFLLPLSIVNLFVTAAEVIAWDEALPYWIIPVNIAIAVISIVIFTRLLGFQGQTRQVVHAGRHVIRPTATGGVINVEPTAAEGS